MRKSCIYDLKVPNSLNMADASGDQQPSATNEKTNSPKDSIDTENNEPVLEDDWLIRDCDLYWDEYKECTSFRGRFHQYFIFGKTLNCNEWRKDYNNCCKWNENKDLKACQAVIESEKARRQERLRAHYRNDTWKKRDGPPADWDKPLPEWMIKRDEKTYLAARAIEIKEGKEEETITSSCSIM